nr:putative nucleotide-diphospho-sugar transferase [Rhizobium populisoli]
MQVVTSPLWAAVVGLPYEGISLLTQLIRDVLPVDIPVVSETSLRDLQKQSSSFPLGAVSTSVANLFSVGKLIDAGEKIRIIAFVDHPGRLLTVRHPDISGQYRYSFDHCLHLAENGVATLSDPGILYAAKLMRSVLGRHPPTLTVRYEDLNQHPEKVAESLRAFLVEGRASDDERNIPVPALFDATTEDVARIVRQFRLAPELFDVAKRWGYSDDRSWFKTMSASSSAASEDRPGTIVAYYTQGTRYEREAHRMMASLSRLGLPIALSAVDDAGGWLANVRRKPHFLKERRNQLVGPLLYVDVDAVVHSDPWPYLHGYTGDIAVAGHHGKNYISGTILINDTEGARAFLEEWCSDQSSKPEAWDQHSLHDVVIANSMRSPQAFRVEHLPPAMCMVFDRRFSQPVTPVIEHLQASREEKKAVDNEGVSALLLDKRHARLSELEAELGLSKNSNTPVLQSAYRDLKVDDRISRTAKLSVQHESDIARWADKVNLLSQWSGRAEIVASLIDAPDVVLDLGCGGMDLERHLKPGVTYQPSDIVSRDARTIVCDLNKGELPDIKASVVSMLGVLEYIHDPKLLLDRLAVKWPRLLVTYYPTDFDGKRDRSAHGWFSALSSAGLVSIAVSAGYDLKSIVPSSDSRERIYLFQSNRCPS